MMISAPKFFAFLLAALSLASVPFDAAFAAVAGQVQFTNGNVQVTTLAGVTRSLSKGDVINEGDMVTTALASSAQIKMRDGGFVAVRPDTRMKFDQFFFSGKQDGHERSFFSLFKGGFRAVTGFVGMLNKQNYKITTPAATIGIRGTDHETVVVPAGNSSSGGGGAPSVPPGTYSKVNVGSTSVTTSLGSVNVQPNQMGYASGMNAVPALAPINTAIFTVATAPTKTIKENKEEKQEQKSEKQGGGQTVAKETKSEKTAQANESKQETQTETTPENKSETSPVARTETTQETGKPTAASESTVAGDATVLRNVTADVTPLNTVTTAQTVAPVANISVPLVVVVAPSQIVPITLVDSSGNTLNISAQTVTTSTGAVKTVEAVAPILANGGTLAEAVNPVVVAPPVVPTEAAYSFDHIAGQSVWAGNNRTWGWLASLNDLTYVAGGSAASGQLSSFIERSIGGGSGWVNTTTITGGTATSANAPSYASTGIEYGVWSGYSSQTSLNTSLLGSGVGGGTSNNWMYGPKGYWDSQYWNGTTLSLSGSFSYQADGATAPYSQQLGLSGVLNSASITANFLSMVIDASLDITMPGYENWGVSISALPVTNINSTGAFYAYASPTGVGNTMAVSRSVGLNATLVSCTTCSGNLNVNFTGQNFAGAIMSYVLYNNTLLGENDVQGNVAFSRVTAISAATPQTTTAIVVGQPNSSSTGGGYSTWTISGNVLTSYGSTGNSVTVSCPTCTATASGQVATSGIYYGNWNSGSYSNSNTQGGSANSKSYWISGPEAGPLYLSQALTGTASYVFDAGLVTNGNGVSGTVQSTSALSLDFTRQIVGINLDLLVPDTASVMHTWNATAQALLQGNQGIGGTGFRASTSNGVGSTLLTVKVDGAVVTSTNGSSEVNGQLTGAGLNGAIMSFNLNGLTSETVQGIAAFTGTAQGTALSHRYVSISYFDELGVIPVLGFYANNATRVTQDTAGNLTKFDIQGVSNGGSASTTVSIMTATPLELGTDPVTGISWGRWAGGSIGDTERITNTLKERTNPGSLHWIAESATSSAVTLPISGTYTYIKAGGTSPTDQLGNVGVLNSATLTANFTAQTVNMGVNASVSGATLNATATNAPIIQKTAFYASSQEPSASSSYLTVTCTGACNGAAGGTIVGKFTGTGAAGAVMAYGLQNGSATVGATNPVVNGVVAFHR